MLGTISGLSILGIIVLVLTQLNQESNSELLSYSDNAQLEENIANQAVKAFKAMEAKEEAAILAKRSNQAGFDAMQAVRVKPLDQHKQSSRIFKTDIKARVIEAEAVALERDALRKLSQGKFAPSMHPDSTATQSNAELKTKADRTDHLSTQSARQQMNTYFDHLEEKDHVRQILLGHRGKKGSDRKGRSGQSLAGKPTARVQQCVCASLPDCRPNPKAAGVNRAISIPAGTPKCQCPACKTGIERYGPEDESIATAETVSTTALLNDIDNELRRLDPSYAMQRAATPQNYPAISNFLFARGKANPISDFTDSNEIGYLSAYHNQVENKADSIW